MENLIFKKETHQYFFNEEEKISVSKIISNYLGSDYFCKECQQESSNCVCINTCMKCDNIRNACIKGNAVHKVAQLYFKNINCENAVEKIKGKIKTIPVFTEKILKYCDNLLEFLEEKFKKNKEYINEQMYCADIVAGTPDLIFKSNIFFETYIKNYNDLYSIIDFKTYKNMTKELKYKAELQLTAYYWLLNLNGFTLSNKHFIIWIKENKVETISVDITKEKLHEWEMAIELYKEDFNLKGEK